MRKKINTNIFSTDRELLAVGIYIVSLFILDIFLKNVKSIFIKFFNLVPYNGLKLIIAFSLQYLILLGMLYYILKKFLYLNVRKYLFYQFKKLSIKSVFFIFLVYILTVVFIGLIKFVIYYFHLNIFGFGNKEQVVNFVEIFVKEADVIEFFLIFFVIVFIGPLVEEIIFRGFITKILVEKLGYSLGIIVDAFVFAFFHFEWEVICYLFILGLVLNYIYCRYRSLTHSLLFHIIVNFVTFMILMIKVYSG